MRDAAVVNTSNSKYRIRASCYVTDRIGVAIK
jgi:hypothetical protein